MHIFLMLFLSMQAAQPAQPAAADVRAAVTRALPLLQVSAGEFAAKRTCVSCHHNILPILALHLAHGHGFAVDAAVLKAVEDRTFNKLRKPPAFDEAVQAATISNPTPEESYLLMAANAAGIPKDMTTAVYARRLAAWQRDGHWVTSDFRPPHSSSEFTATATAIRAMRLYMPDQMQAVADNSIRSARRWMLAARPESTEDAAFRLMGFVWAGAPPTEIQIAQRDLLAMQRTDGGWSQSLRYDSDAYSTGEALYALREAGMAITDVRWSKAAQFLIATQAPDGTWRVHSRMLSPAKVSPAYFDTGFPYEKDEFLSYAGTCWAVMALLRSLPEPAVVPEPWKYNGGSSTAVEPWMKTALFGTASQLAALLSAGLDPNTATTSGTSVLMMAAPDADKVRLLLLHGANAKARSSSGADALTIAAAYRGTASSLRLLLAAGAEAEPPRGVSVPNTPLDLASMTGDLDNVQVLLAHGANAASNSALSEAVTFGYPDVVKALVRAGADPNIADNTGINLIHWAVITNRPAMIPVLAALGVPVNVRDENGFSPLMYAVSIDFGDTRSLKALLRAGADRNLPNNDGRNALEQARYLKHTDMVPLLR